MYIKVYWMVGDKKKVCIDGGKIIRICKILDDKKAALASQT